MTQNPKNSYLQGCSIAEVLVNKDMQSKMHHNHNFA